MSKNFISVPIGMFWIWICRAIKSSFHRTNVNMLLILLIELLKLSTVNIKWKLFLSALSKCAPAKCYKGYIKKIEKTLGLCTFYITISSYPHVLCNERDRYLRFISIWTSLWKIFATHHIFQQNTFRSRYTAHQNKIESKCMLIETKKENDPCCGSLKLCQIVVKL